MTQFIEGVRPTLRTSLQKSVPQKKHFQHIPVSQLIPRAERVLGAILGVRYV